EEMAGGQAAVLGTGAEGGADLGDQDDPVAPAAEGLTEDLFHDAARAADEPAVTLVDVGRVDEVDAAVDGRMNEADGLGLADGGAKGHRPQADGRNQQAAGAEYAVVH